MARDSTAREPTKRQPQRTRRSLLDQARLITLREGLEAVSIQAVADAAGVTKGGLFHHFQSKQALLEAMFRDLIERFDRRIEECIDPDVNAYGRFSRAYVEATLADLEQTDHCSCAEHSVAFMNDTTLRPLWTRWLESRLKQHKKTDSDPLLAVVRYAADGLWHGGVEARSQLKAYLVFLTKHRVASLRRAK